MATGGQLVEPGFGVHREMRIWETREINMRQKNALRGNGKDSLV